MNPASARLTRAALLAVLGWSASFWLLAQLGLGGRYSLHPDDPAAVQQLPALDLNRAESQLGPLSEYQVVAERPLFNPDRRPLPPADQPGGDEKAPPPVENKPLEIVLTSVVLAGKTRLAIVADPAGKNSQSLKVGESLEGEQSAWKLVELQPRAAVFEGPTGRSRVELRVFNGVGGQSPTPVAVSEAAEDKPAEQGGEATADDSPESRAEMIRKRIEERRRQMREEAARANQERGQ